MPFGPRLLEEGGAEFRLWAPGAGSVELLLWPGDAPDADADCEAMPPTGQGWHSLAVERARPGDLYAFRIDGELEVPDPASRHNPGDVHGPSALVQPEAFEWDAHEDRWTGRPLHEAVFYELHVGSFTREGTFAAVQDRLDHLARLGVTAIELMPVADFPGHFGWGYDGVLPFAPESRYGTPADLKALVQAAHARRMMVFLDVVYNHFGPDGNYLPRYAPPFFTERHHTPWGAAIGLEGPQARPVRDFFIHNALYWLEEFRFDGLRLDAAHALIDDSPTHLLQELAGTVHRHFAPTGRQVHLVMEHEHNPARLLDPRLREKRLDAQWNDDFHHALHVMLTGEDQGYYAPYRHHPDFAPVELLARTLAEGYAFQGEPMGQGGAPRGEPSGHLLPTCFIQFLQNHDHIGNRARGERLATLVAPPALRAATALLLLAPQPPMLFMGEEFGSKTPFLFFADHRGDLGDAVREGRRREFAKFAEFSDPARRATIPDPVKPATFEASQLDWDAFDAAAPQAQLELHRLLLDVRFNDVVPRLPMLVPGTGRWQRYAGHDAFEVRWQLDDGDTLLLRANFGDQPLDVPLERTQLLFQLADTPRRLGPWDVQLLLTS
jgi:1,4-alpha-glucan branching enzyme/maltooligosyltrehalose trehalohydrolase